MVDAQRRLFLRGKGSKAAASPARPPWSLREGDGGFPVIDFSAAGCSLCGDCSRACASGAIGRSDDGAAAFTWKADVDGRCLARHGVECRICGDACDAGALRFVPTLGGVAQLRIEREACSGCGDCVSTCPVHALRVVDAQAAGC